jgi:sugar lactone lactonase YvrE
VAAQAAAPLITTTSFSGISATTATLQGAVDPNATRVKDAHFEYLPLSTYEDNGESFDGAIPTDPQAIEATVTANGALVKDSNHITVLETPSGTFLPGQSISASGIPAGTFVTGVKRETIKGVLQETLTVSKPATEDQSSVKITARGGEAKGTGDLAAESKAVESLKTATGTFVAGQSISGPGIPPNTRIDAAFSNPNPQLTLSREATASASAAPLLAGVGQPISAQIIALEPGSAYAFRLVATNTKPETVFGPTLVFRTLASTPTYGPCENEAFRGASPSGALPDCRAYEQASPIEKNGGDLTAASIYTTKASVNGDRISFNAATPIQGGEGAQVFTPPYLASRGADGWTTRGLMPSFGLGQEGLITSQSADLSQFFGYVVKIGAERETSVFERSSADGSTQLLFPRIAGIERPKVSGSNADGSVVFFEGPGTALTPDAAAGQPNLYVWDRESGQIRLVGVFNDDAAPSKGSFAGPYNWMQGHPAEGGANSYYFTRDLRANSADGSRAYFTAAGGQLYLRENPTEPQSPVTHAGQPNEECTDPALACTIHVSASEKTNGGPTGNGPDPAGSAPAAFMAASADGSTAYFTSSEKLTNDANTGPEQPPASIGRADLGAPDPQSTLKEDFLPKHAIGLATSPDGKYLYWADPSKGTIGRANVETEPPTEVDDEFIDPGETSFFLESEPGVGEELTADSTPRYVAVDEHHVYWTNTGPLAPRERPGVAEGDPLPEAGTIGRAVLDASGNLIPDSVKPDFITGASNPEGIAVNAQHAYWVNAASPDTPTYSAVARSSIDGTAVEQSFTSLNGTPKTLALTNDRIFVTDQRLADRPHDIDHTASIASFPITGGSRENSTGMYLGVATVVAMTISGSELYWSVKDVNPGVDVPTAGTFTPLVPSIGHVPIADFGGGCGTNPACEKEALTPKGDVAGLAVSGNNLHLSINGEAPANPGNDLYRFQAGASPHLADLTPDATGNGAEVQGVLGASKDGSYLYFVANGALVPGAVPGNCHGDPEEGVQGRCNLYLSHEGELIFIARLDSNLDSQDWRASGVKGGGSTAPRTSFLSTDGTTLLFRSSRQLTSYDNEGVPEFYRYRAGNPGSLTCITCNPTGVPPSARPTIASIESTSLASNPPAPVLSRNLSTDGDRFLFETSEALLAADTNGDEACPVVFQDVRACQDVYQWEAEGTGSCESETQNGGCLSLISTGRSPDASYFADASASGDDVFFFTRSALVGSDTDSLRDVYDARVEGGLASQNQPPPKPPCEGEATCKPPLSTPPTPGSAGTATFIGPPDPKPKHKKPKRHHRKKKHHSKKHHTQTKRQGGSR